MRGTEVESHAAGQMCHPADEIFVTFFKTHTSQSEVRLCSRQFLPSGVLRSEIIEHHTSLTPHSLWAHTDSASHSTSSGRTHTHTLYMYMTKCEITLLKPLLTPTLDELRGWWLLNLKWSQWTEALSIFSLCVLGSVEHRCVLLCWNDALKSTDTPSTNAGWCYSCVLDFLLLLLNSFCCNIVATSGQSETRSSPL